LDVSIGNFDSDGRITSFTRVVDSEEDRGIFGEVLEGDRAENSRGIEIASIILKPRKSKVSLCFFLKDRI